MDWVIATSIVSGGPRSHRSHRDDSQMVELIEGSQIRGAEFAPASINYFATAITETDRRTDLPMRPPEGPTDGKQLT
jgi:hypothetical protein